MRVLVFTLLLVAVLFFFASSQHDHPSTPATPTVNTPIPVWQLNLNYKQYKQSKSLLKNNLYDIYWNIDDATETLYMALSVKTNGWVGIGFSPNGFMPESDLIIGWVNSQGKAFVDDYYANGRSPQKDVERGGTADVKLVGGKEVDGRTIIEFKRQLATADPNDFVIAHEEMRVIIAFRDGTDRPEPNDDGTGLAQHTFTGSFKIQFYKHAMGPAYPETDTESLIIKMSNHSLDTSKRTNYICQKFSLPEIMHVEKDFHIVEYRALIENPNVVHHMIIYECDSEPVNLPDGPYDCLKKSTAGCYKMMAAWGIGAVPTFTLPNEAGFRISGGESQYLRGIKHFRLEVHYDYPYNYTQTILDSSGFEIIYTPSIRKYDAGVLTAGYAMNKIAIPPGTAEQTFTGYCNHDCTDKMVEPVKMIAYMLHMHLAGRKMWTYLFRNSTIGLSREERLKQAIRMEKLDYDFAHQEQVAFTPALDLYPGDELETSCVYNTEDRTTVTKGGYSTYDEMCFNFIVFYPRERSFAFCYNGACQPFSESMGKKRIIQTTSEQKPQQHYILQNAESIGIIVAICIVTVLAIVGIIAIVAGSKVVHARLFPQPTRPQQQA